MSAMNDIIMNAPVPGESMTAEFGSRPWHSPPEIEDPVEALDWHLDRLEEPKTRKAMVQALQLGIPVRDLNLGMLRAAVGQSKHDMDTMFIIASVTHEALEVLAEEEGIDYKSGFEETEEDRDQEYVINAMIAKKMLAKHSESGDLDGFDESDLEAPETEHSPMAEAEIELNKEEQAPKGLMARGN